ncbi:hypothetical protein D9M71_803110 [compost metagenome]
MVELVLYALQGGGEGGDFGAAGQVHALVQALQRSLRQVLQAERELGILVEHQAQFFRIDITGGQGIDAVFKPGDGLATQFQRVR